MKTKRIFDLSPSMVNNWFGSRSRLRTSNMKDKVTKVQVVTNCQIKVSEKDETLGLYSRYLK